MASPVTPAPAIAAIVGQLQATIIRRTHARHTSPLSTPLSVLSVLAVSIALSCAPTSVARDPNTPPPAAAAQTQIPAGFGTLRQEDIAVQVQQFGLRVRAIALDESVIRVLSPDSYRTMHDVVESQRERIDAVRRRTALPSISAWYLSFFGVEVGEARFSPMEVVISNVGRDFRPIEVIGLSPGFGSQRLRQREVQHALYLFDGQLDVNQPLTISYETARSSDWASALDRIERERSLVRSRARGQDQP